MEATTSFSSNLNIQHPNSPLARSKNPRKPLITLAAYSRKDSGDYRGRMVDENMIVLRMRIRETKMLETRDEPPSNWMEWEKKYYAHNGYNEDVFEAIGFLQCCLMDMRPGLAFGLIALVTLSLVMSTGLALFHAIEISQIVVSFLFHMN